MLHISKAIQSGALTLSALALVVVPAAMAVPAFAVSSQAATRSTEQQAKVQDKLDDVKGKATQAVEKIRTEKTVQTQEARQKLCQNREKTMQNKLNAFQNAGDTQLNQLQNAYEKLKTYQVENNVTMANSETLTTAADVAEATATTNVGALSSAVGTGFDCASENVAVQLGTVKQAGIAARDALRTYRTALHDVLVALVDATEVTTETGDAQ